MNARLLKSGYRRWCWSSTNLKVIFLFIFSSRSACDTKWGKCGLWCFEYSRSLKKLYINSSPFSMLATCSGAASARLCNTNCGSRKHATVGLRLKRKAVLRSWMSEKHSYMENRFIDYRTVVFPMRRHQGAPQSEVLTVTPASHWPLWNLSLSHSRVIIACDNKIGDKLQGAEVYNFNVELESLLYSGTTNHGITSSARRARRLEIQISWCRSKGWLWKT